jgi:3-methyladenine DNA glycosylase AlkD
VTEAAETAQRIADELKALPSRTVLTLRRARMRWSSALQAESPATVLAVVETLIRTINPRFVAYELVLHHPGALALVDQRVAERLAGDLCSWGDVDAFSTLIAGPAWLAGHLPDEAIHDWAGSSSRWWRRAALVSTTGLNVPNRGGPGDTDRTLAVCQRLVRDRDDMVVKALSWALRELARHDPSAVAGFVDKHSTDIARRVRREVMNKLTTGVKSRRHQGRPPGSRLVDQRAV